MTLFGARRDSSASELPLEGRLPGFAGATGWLNSVPLSPADLRGKVVLVEFWTFTCINWIRTLPFVRSWFERYRDDGLVVVGVHTPEFAFERHVEHVRRAAEAMRIDFPIAVDSDYAIWRAFANRYWPALYFVDADGQIRHHHFGEGEYEVSERVIQRLLASAGVDAAGRELLAVDAAGVEARADWEELRSREIYVGYDRAVDFASPGGASRDKLHEYTLPAGLRLDRWALVGNWTVGREAAQLIESGGRIAHRFHARDLHLVMAPGDDGRPVRFRVELDGEALGLAHGVDTDEQGEGAVTEPRLYQLIRQPTPVDDRTAEVVFLDAGVRAYVFTFG